MKGYEIRQLMADQKIKVGDLAAKIGVSQASVSRTIHRQTKSVRIQGGIAEAINRPVTEVFPEQE